MSLKLRLNLIVTCLLALILFIGTALTVLNARKNVRAEVASAEKLTLYLFDTAILHNADLITLDKAEHPFQLHRLDHMRHLKIELRDPAGRIIESNHETARHLVSSDAPPWFETLLNKTTPPWEPQTRPITYQGRLIGTLVITPDPTYEYAEIWKQITDSLWLVSIFLVSVNLMISWAVSTALKPTDEILLALNELERGNLKARLPSFALPELARIGSKFNHMVETLELSVSRNHRLTQQIITLQEEERKSLARDLHDEFGQCLTAIDTDAAVILKQSEGRHPDIHRSAHAIHELSRHLIDLVSGLLQHLRPGVLDELGLAAALQDLIESWRARNPQVVCRLSMEAMPEGLEETSEISIFRMVQEGLTNIARHARATEVGISVRNHDTNGISGILVEVNDNGIGFDTTRTEGLGLPGMRERIEGLGGSWAVVSHPGAGTRVSAWIPASR